MIEIYATASAPKRDFLRALGVPHVYRLSIGRRDEAAQALRRFFVPLLLDGEAEMVGPAAFGPTALPGNLTREEIVAQLTGILGRRPEGRRSEGRVTG